MTGNKKLALIKPPAIKAIVATSDGHCKFDKPIIECPEVQPPAYRVPKPTKNPPTTKKINPFRVNRLCQLNISVGISPVKSFIPY